MTRVELLSMGIGFPGRAQSLDWTEQRKRRTFRRDHCTLEKQVQMDSMNSTTSALLEAAIALSNQGAYCVVGGNLGTAIRLTRRALHIMKLVYHADTVRLVCGTGLDTNNADEARVAFPIEATSPLVDDPPTTNETVWLQRSALYYIYARPMVLPTIRGSFTYVNHRALFYTLCLHITFNLALACHLMGAELGVSALLQRAKCLYVALLGAPVARVDSPHTRNSLDIVTGSLLLRCVIQNNLGCLHYEHCEFDESEFHLRAVYEMMLLCGELLVTDPGNVYLSSYEAAELLLNSKFLRRPRYAQAA